MHSRIHKAEYAQVVHITVEPGESLKKHFAAVDVSFCVLGGISEQYASEMRCSCYIPLLVSQGEQYAY